nr:MAG TPA: hypothetical protein [Caudoviricetes sp.]
MNAIIKPLRTLAAIVAKLTTTPGARNGIITAMIRAIINVNI